MIEFNNFSKGQEDFFLVKFIDDNKVELNMLFDGGINSEKCLEHIRDNVDGKLDYIVLTHIDQDHIKGLLELYDKAENCNLKSKLKDTVFVYNKFVTGIVSYNQAETFEKMIQGREIICSYKEYQYNSGNAIFFSVEQRKKLSKKEKNQIYITFLWPSNRKEIELLYDYYQLYKEKDKNPSGNAYMVNRSSIMCIVEYEETLLLMAGDGYFKDILPSIRILTGSQTICPISQNALIKIPHHGSTENNKGLDEIIEKIPCDKFVLTNVEEDHRSKRNSVKVDDYIIKLSKTKSIYSNSDYEGLNITKEQIINII